jgi:hypothetical protein
MYTALGGVEEMLILWCSHEDDTQNLAWRIQVDGEGNHQVVA